MGLMIMTFLNACSRVLLACRHTNFFTRTSVHSIFAVLQMPWSTRSRLPTVVFLGRHGSIWCKKKRSKGETLLPESNNEKKIRLFKKGAKKRKGVFERGSRRCQSDTENTVFFVSISSKSLNSLSLKPLLVCEIPTNF